MDHSAEENLVSDVSLCTHEREQRREVGLPTVIL